MIKFGSRQNLKYPAMLVLFIGLLKIVDSLIDENFKIGEFLLLIIWFIGKSSFGVISSIYIYCKSRSNKNIPKTQGDQLKKRDNKIKIIILVFFAAFFDFFVSLVRTFYIHGDKVSKSIKSRVRCCQLFIAGLLCYYALQIKLFKHHFFCLIVIFINLVIIIICEIIYKQLGLLDDSYSALLLSIFSVFGRAFLDTTEKYLFEFNYLEPLKVLAIEGIINFFSIFGYYFYCGHPNEFKDLDTKKPIDSYEWINIAIFILLLSLYMIFAGFRNVYRVLTIKYYSPMTRVLAEAVFDPFLLSYKLRSIYNWPYYWINMICLVIMVFSSLVFNEFLVLYCCGLEYDTHLEINKRARLSESFSEDRPIDVDDNYETEFPKEEKKKEEISLTTINHLE